MRFLKVTLCFIFIHQSFLLQAQLVGEMGDESKLYAETKQVNQFFRRFNGEEDEEGKRYYPEDKRYRNTKLRKQYIKILFDHSNTSLSESLANEFLQDVLDKDEPKY
ncbi:MAG: hypothetical protein R3345_15275, partial [Fulvivirga sp.]|nr:hypothetical protein [Fulvivirga sp.]